MATLEPGSVLEPFVVESVDVGRMKTMALLLRDPNPIHWDVESLRRLGLAPSPINQGPVNMSYLMELAIRAAGDRRRLLRFAVRFLANVTGGQRVECTGTVTAVDEAAGTAELELSATADGEPVLAASATIALSG
jgi:acyl dehydratase